jgi:hypothetical protein
VSPDRGDDAQQHDCGRQRAVPAQMQPVPASSTQRLVARNSSIMPPWRSGVLRTSVLSITEDKTMFVAPRGRTRLCRNRNPAKLLRSRGPLKIVGTWLDAAVVLTEAGYTYWIVQTVMRFAGERRRCERVRRTKRRVEAKSQVVCTRGRSPYYVNTRIIPSVLSEAAWRRMGPRTVRSSNFSLFSPRILPVANSRSRHWRIRNTSSNARDCSSPNRTARDLFQHALLAAVGVAGNHPGRRWTLMLAQFAGRTGR